MPHIALPPHKPGMVALAAYRPDAYARLAPLADLLLHQQHPTSTLSPGDRELIATYVSSLNKCAYCTSAHGAVAAAHLHSSPGSISDLLGQESGTEGKEDSEGQDEGGEIKLSAKMKALLKIAAAVTVSGKSVTGEMVGAAKGQGASEMDVHDTVLIASAFCMFNRYVDGLGTEMPGSLEVFEMRGREIGERGYVGIMKGGGSEDLRREG
ncbi:hypothetical protein N431DRAFT_433088 [Stipitochalara longipes BDJ]|nr:hypothetical protein N431DRAFT_433088 [Stipitochalara longipes BDJ]